MPQSIYGPDYIQSADRVVDTSTAISGQITCTGVGTAVQGTNSALANGVYIKALAANTAKVYVGNTGAGTVSNTTGFELSGGDMIAVNVSNVNQLWFDGIVTDKVCWLEA